MRKPIRTQNVINQRAITVGGLTSVLAEFPLGEPWFMMLLTITAVLTHGSGSGPVADGILLAIKNILIKTDRDGVIVNASGRGLFRLAQFLSRVAPALDSFAAATGTYRAHIPIYFANPLFLRPEDSVLDTSRYNTVEFYLTFGGLADLLGTVGTDTAVFTLDLAIVKGEQSTKINPAGKPRVKPYISAYPPQDPSGQQYIEIEKARDLAIAQIAAQAANAVTAGVPFSGTPADTIIDTWQVHDNIGFPVLGMKHYNAQYLAKIEQQIETFPAGWFYYNFVKDGSIFTAYPTGDKSMLRLEWINGTLSTSGITPMIFAIRALSS